MPAVRSSWCGRRAARQTVPDEGQGGSPVRSRAVRSRSQGRLGWLVILAVLALVIPASGAPSRAADPPADGSGLDVVLDSTQHWLGTNDILMSVYDMAGAPLADAAAPLLIELVGPSGQVLTAEPVIERFATYGRKLYRARVPLDEVGRWELQVRAPGAGDGRHGATVLDVSPDQGTPALGSLVPGGATPTMRDAHSLMHHISSDIEPLSAFYTWSLDEALQQHQPTAFVMDTYAARPNSACGGALGLLHDVFIDYPGLVVVHAEPWKTMPGPDGMLQLDPPGGPAVLTDYAKAWGISEPPWVFIIDRDGRLQAKFTGVLGSDELRAALASVTAWRPAA